jgi:hypothetical protein
MAEQNLQVHIDHLFSAELQFRMASAVRLATKLKVQPLELPIEWTHGSQRVEYAEIALRPDQAQFAACFLHRSATYLMAVAIKEAIQAAVPKPWESPDPDLAGAYQIARQIRNAFVHAPFAPTWMIDKGLRDKVFSVRDIIELKTGGLHGTAFDWRHYGGLLALYRLCRFVRIEILQDPVTPRKAVPIPTRVVRQQGDLILQMLDQIPPDFVPVPVQPSPDGGIPLGQGHVLHGDAKLYQRQSELIDGHENPESPA